MLGGQLLSLKGPVELKVEVCGAVVHHPFYFHDENTTFLMGFDLITAAGLIIDSANKCVVYICSHVLDRHTAEFDFDYRQVDYCLDC